MKRASFGPVATCAAVSAALALAAPAPAAAQGFGGRGGGIGPGSTVQGDVLRGEGIFLNGLGQYNYFTAMAGSINTDAYIKLSEYTYMYWTRDNTNKAAHRTNEIARVRGHYAAILERIKNSPDRADVERGDALNSLANQLLDPRIAPSSFKGSPVTLEAGTIRHIPFRFGQENATIAMDRMDVRRKWPPGLRGADFAAERRAYERAFDAALDQQTDGKLSKESIAAVEAAVAGLSARLDQVVPPSRSALYLEAKNFVNRLERAAEQMKHQNVEKIIGEIATYPGTTVHELVLFMQRNNLQFGVPEIGDERELYPGLYAAMKQQYELVKGLVDDGK